MPGTALMLHLIDDIIAPPLMEMGKPCLAKHGYIKSEFDTAQNASSAIEPFAITKATASAW
jgi:hypothetical protein